MISNTDMARGISIDSVGTLYNSQPWDPPSLREEWELMLRRKNSPNGEKNTFNIICYSIILPKFGFCCLECLHYCCCWIINGLEQTKKNQRNRRAL
jgi:hypothetical protein